MNSFEWIDARTVDDAVHWLEAGDGAVVAKAGGLDLLDLMKEGIVRPSRVINLRTIAGLDEIRSDEQGTLRLGALAPLARIASDPAVVRQFGALAAAIEHAATPQVRNVATIGGNLLQRPRCWYFRSEQFARERVVEAARHGEHQYHGIFDVERTPLVHASTPATALLAYGATVHVKGAHGERSTPLADFLLPPDPTRGSDVAMQRGEVLTHVTLRVPEAGTFAAYHKQTERDSYDWPICDVAVVLRLGKERIVEAASTALGWVAPTPMRAAEAEQLLVGRRVDAAIAAEAAKAVVAKATPLAKNGYKVPVLEAVIRRTILAAANADAD